MRGFPDQLGIRAFHARAVPRCRTRASDAAPRATTHAPARSAASPRRDASGWRGPLSLQAMKRARALASGLAVGAVLGALARRTWDARVRYGPWGSLGMGLSGGVDGVGSRSTRRPARPFVEGNRVTWSDNAEVFDAMEEAIRAARHSVHVDVYIWKPGAAGRPPRRARVPPGARGREGADPRGSDGQHRLRRAALRAPARGGLRGALLPAAEEAPVRPHRAQPPQARRGRRPGGLHRRLRHRAGVGRDGGPRAALARRERRGGGARRAADADGVRRPLARDRRRSAARRGVRARPGPRETRARRT